MKYILVSKTWKRESEIIPTNMKVIKDIVYKLIDLNFKAFINIEDDIYEPIKLSRSYYGSGSVDSINNEILNKICFYLSIYKNSNIYLKKGETSTGNSYVYELKLKNNKLNGMEIKLLSLYIQGFNKKMIMGFQFNDTWKKCYLNYDKKKLLQPKNTDIKLYTYQANTVYWMQEIENNKIDFSMNASVDISDMSDTKDKKLFFDPVNVKITKKELLQKINYRGAILGDDMGSGKTICCASIIQSNQSKVNTFTRIEKRIYTKATLVIVPGHLAKQWEFELKKFNKKLKVILYLTRVHHKKYSIKEITETDILIVSTQFLCNKTYYLDIMKRLHRESSEDKWKDKPSDILMGNVFRSLEKEYNTENDYNIGIFNKSKEYLLNSKAPVLNMFYFHRIIADEAHQILSARAGYSVNDETLYLQNTLLNLEADHYWYVSGTPFVENSSLFTILEFLKLGIKDYKQLSSELVAANINSTDIYNHLLKTLFIRHTKESIKDELNIPPVIEENIFLEFTEIEKALYSKEYKGGIISRQMCCHPSINDHDRQAFIDSDNIPNLLETKEKIIKSREKELELFENRLKTLLEKNALVVNQSEYSKKYFLQKKKEFGDKIHSIRYILKIFKDINIEKKDDDGEEEMCPILLEPIIEGVITKCGHKFSKEGLLDGLKATRKRECPLCRTPLGPGDIYEMSSNVKNEDGPKIDEYTYKYGTKMGKLIRMVLEIMIDKKNRIIIFSQWDNLLKLISNTLNEINISNVRCKGNTYQRNSAIMKFKKGLNSKKKNKTAIILLSLENAAAGTNLTEASHIFLVDPIKGSKEHVKATEDQCIGRACRIGQENQVKIYRLIIKDTIEEEIFKECYETNDITDELSDEVLDEILN